MPFILPILYFASGEHPALPRQHTFPPHASYCARRSGVLICDASPSSLLPRRPFFRSPQHARRPVKALHIPPAACVTQLFPAARFPAERFTSRPAKPCIPCRRLSSSGARRQSKPASRQRPIRPHHRKSTAFSRRAALSRDIAPFQAAVALHGQARRIKSALQRTSAPVPSLFLSKSGKSLRALPPDLSEICHVQRAESTLPHI